MNLDPLFLFLLVLTLTFFPLGIIRYARKFRRSFLLFYLGNLYGTILIFGKIGIVNCPIFGVKVHFGALLYTSIIFTIILFVYIEKNLVVVKDVFIFLFLIYIFQIIFVYTLIRLISGGKLIPLFYFDLDLLSFSINIDLFAFLLNFLEIIIFFWLIEHIKRRGGMRFKHAVKNTPMEILTHCIAFILILIIDGFAFTLYFNSISTDVKLVLKDEVNAKLLVGLYYCFIFLGYSFLDKNILKDYYIQKLSLGSIFKPVSIGDFSDQEYQKKIFSIEQTKKEIFSFLLDKSPSPEFIMDNDFKVYWTNHSFAKIFKHPSSEIFDYREILDPSQVGEFEKAVESVREFPKLVKSFRVLRNDGKLMRYQHTFYTVYHENIKENPFLFILLEDESLNVDLARMKTLKEERNRIFLNFREMIHDIKNYINIERNYLELLKSTDEFFENNREVKEIMDILDKNINNLNQMVNDVHELYGKITIRPESIKIGDIIGEVIENYNRMEEINFKIVLPENLPEILGDRTVLLRIFHNLINNAIDAKHDRRDLNIIIAGTPERYPQNPFGEYDIHEFVRIDVKDNGKGIPEEYIGKIFNAGFTTKKKGKGLGLAIVYEYMKKNLGYISVKSEYGKGTTFSLYFPVYHNDYLKYFK